MKATSSSGILKGRLRRCENLPICSNSYENNTLKVSHS